MLNVLIVGGTGELGHAVVPRLLRDYRCIVQYRTAESFARLEQSIGRHEHLTGVGAAEEVAEPMHALVHLAGAFRAGSAPDDFQAMLDANVLPVVHSFATAIPRISDGGRIVAISSIATLTHAAGLGAYVASKAAVNALVQTTALELVTRRISVNALLPAALGTPKNLQSMPREELVPLDRVAETIAFLLSDAGASVSGQLIALQP